MISSLLAAHCADTGTLEQTPARSPQTAIAPAPASDARTVLAAEGKWVSMGRIEGYGNPKTGELWMRAVSDATPRSSNGVAVQAQALSASVPGYCTANVMNDGVADSNPAGTFEFYTKGSVTGASMAELSSFSPATCYNHLQAPQQNPAHSNLFSTFGAGCALEHVGNFTTTTFNHVYLDIDSFNGDQAAHLPYGPPYTTGTIATPNTPGARRAPAQSLGLWDFGTLAPNGLVNMWVYFKNGNATDFNWTGNLVGEVFENCGSGTGNGMDDDCDGVVDNGCQIFTYNHSCFADTDCRSNSCGGALIVSRFGLAGTGLTDTAGTCQAVCGDGFVENTEGCDDGNTNAHDGCSSTCTLEPTPQWLYSWGDSGNNQPSSNGQNTDVAIDNATGGVYALSGWGSSITVNGVVQTATRFGASLIAVDSTGAYRWVVSSKSSAANSDAHLTRVIIDPQSGDPIVVGSGYGGNLVLTVNNGAPVTVGAMSGSEACYALRLSKTNGSLIWGKIYGSQNNYCQALSQDSAGNVIIGGLFQQSIDFGNSKTLSTTTGDTNAFVAKLRLADGTALAAVGLGSTQATEQTAGVAAIPGTTQVAVGGIYSSGSTANHTTLGSTNYGYSGNQDVFWATVDMANGSVLTSGVISTANNEVLNDVQAGPSHDFYLAGYFDGSTIIPIAGGGNVTLSGSSFGTFLARADVTNGSLKWASGHTLGGNAPFGIRRITVGYDEKVRFIVNSSTGSMTTFGGFAVPNSPAGTHTSHLATVDGANGNVSKYDEFYLTPTVTGFYTNACAVSSSGKLAITGTFASAGSLNGYAFPSFGDWDQFAIQMNYEPTWSSCTSNANCSANATCTSNACSCNSGYFGTGYPASGGCALLSARAFMTDATFTGNLGGAAGADALCQSAATTASLGGNWKAWVSDSTSSPSTRFARAGAYKLLNNAAVATSWTDLTDSTIAVPLEMSETMAVISGSPGRTWTGTNPDGTWVGTPDCNGWTSASAGANGEESYSDSNTDGRWSYTGTLACNQLRHLYCFEQ